MARFDINNVEEVAPKGGWEKINWRSEERRVGKEC